MSYYPYDLESYPNIFTFCGKFVGSDDIHIFEISDRINDRDALLNHLSYLRNVQAEMVGFNNLGYDYFLLHELMTNPYTFDHNKAYQLTQKIISSQKFGSNKGFRNIGPANRCIAQIDMQKVCHFDNVNKATSLKALQFAMRSESLEDLPFEVGTNLNDQEKNELRTYNAHDVTETEKFFLKHEHLIDMRREYVTNGILRGDVLNFSDVKIGTEYLVARLGRATCFSGGKPRQTFRELIEYNKIILPKISFRTEPFEEVFSWFKTQHIYIAEAKYPKLEADLAGLKFHFGAGGVHASAENKVYQTTETHQIIDVDVAGMYPAVAIANRFAPEHLGEAFNVAYRQIKDDRGRHAKGTSQNAVLKLAGNGAFGNSNSAYSFMYDPNFTFSITVNGQLQILQLVEMIALLPDCELIQANTDGITIYINKKYENLFTFWCEEWERMTGLVLERVDYSRMWIRDVNNYISETMEGKLKRKGAYWYPLNEKEYEGWYNKDFSNHASKIAAEKVMTHSWQLQTALRLVTNPFDFMLRYKVPRTSKLYIGATLQLKTVRYYVSVSGEPMKKVSPPKGELGQYKRKNKLTDAFFNGVMEQIGRDVWDERVHNKKKSKYEIRETNVQSGWKVKQCNVATDFNWSDVDWSYYIQEAQKIIIGSK